ncbi:hypothetical protein WG922_01655 [Ramlibacter sp. AN1015]|uniref:hypothetical protein n=1 Tax=Ramlibacter sp. AN1015 TaxID=3133428 RepID=UPI0030C01B41
MTAPPCVRSPDDLAALERQTYAEYLPYPGVWQALEHVARSHAQRPALTYLTSADPAAPPQRWDYAGLAQQVRRAFMEKRAPRYTGH